MNKCNNKYRKTKNPADGQGMSIYKVSKLLGHSSIRTSEQHYAPLLTVEIEDFEL
jgi:integrase